MATEPAAEASSSPAARLLVAVALAMFVVFALSTVPGVRPRTFSSALDGWLQGTAYVVVAGIAALRPVTSPVNRLLWSLVAAGVALRALGFVVYLSFVRRQQPQPSPSAADAAWLLMGVVLIAALVLLVRLRTRQRSIGLAFDALLAGLTVGGVAVELLFRTLEAITHEPDPDEIIATNLAYPLLDLVMLVLVVGALVAVGWRSRSTLLLVLGIVGFAVVDSTFAYQVAAGTFRPGTPLAALSLAATGAIAFSGRAPEADLAAPVGHEFSRALLPASLGLVSIGALLYGALRQVPLAGIVLPAVALVVGIARGVFTVARQRGNAEIAIGATHAELVRFQALVENSDDFIAMASPDGTVLYVNPAGRRLVGLDPHRDAATLQITDFLTPEGLQQSLDVEQPAVVVNGRWHGQSTLRDLRGGPPIPVAIASFLMRHPEDGKAFALATVQRDISERVAAQAALQRLADDRQRLLGRLTQAQEDERARIAADVHDDSVQALAAVELRLGLLRRQIDGRDPELAATAASLSESVSRAINRLRDLLFDLESPAVDNDLAAALALAAEHVFEDRVGWHVVGDVDVEVPQTVRVTAYRIVRESLMNVAKHADASTVVVDLRRDRDGVAVTVDDDGCGFDPAVIGPRPGHIGIGGMQDRAQVAGGTLTVEPGPAAGTRVHLWLPVGQVDAEGVGDNAQKGSA